MTTADDMDSISAAQRDNLMAFCDRDEQWWNFVRGVDDERCPICGGQKSQQIGFQVMTYRSFNPELHGKKKIKKRK